ncbi:MAG TPA: hypothetical protein VM901_11585 [Bdellovibrionota bacterium]|nr:hypothetical protein [Bdellovibrionota bacterium]
MYLHQAAEHVNASAAPGDWLAWCSDWGCWKPVSDAPEFAGRLKAPKGVSALPNRKAGGFPLEMTISITCEGEIFKTKSQDMSKALLEVRDEAPRKFFQEPCEFEMSYMVGPENRRMRFKGRIVTENGQKKKLSLKDMPANVRDFVASCIASVDFGTPVAKPAQKAA